jgi:DNA-nicking Smr family endonuclease
MVSGANDDRDNHFQKGFREVRIIHGRGLDVQRKIVRSVLEKHADVLEFHNLPDRGSTLNTDR